MFGMVHLRNPLKLECNNMNANNLQCFGDLDQVFPMTADGLRHSPEKCMQCPEKTSCLKTALTGQKQNTVAEEKLQRAYQSGNISFFQRWLAKKTLHRQHSHE